MKSTPVKDTGMALMNLNAVQTGKKTGTGDFQMIWNNQKNKSTQDSQSAAGKQNASAGQKTDNRQIKQDSYSKIRSESGAQEEETDTVKEMTPQDMERIMELLGQTSAELMQQLADIFGITLEEIQAVMGELEMVPADLLDASSLGALVLQLGGAEDSSALVMDEGLYENYRTMMEQLQKMIQENAKELDKSPEDLIQLAKEPGVGRPGEEAVGLLQENRTDLQQNSDMAGIDEAGAAGEENQGVLPEIQNVSDTEENRQGSQSGENPRHSEEKTDRGEHTNILIQNIRSEQFQPGAVQTESISQNSPWTAETRNIMDQIMEYMKIQLSPDTTSLEMQLHPASLGTLQVQIASKSGVVTANFITQNEAVKAALESQMVQLRESFEEQGVKVEAIEVTVQTHEFERNLEQGRGRNQQEPEKRNRTRKIHLGDISVTDELSEEDALTAEMMKMDGSTVDYTA